MPSDGPTVGALKKRIKAMANSLSLAAPQFGEGVGNAYLVWCMFELAGVLQAAGQNVVAKDYAGATPKIFYVRAAPGLIPGPHEAKSKTPCHFEIDGAVEVLELHASVRHLGLITTCMSSIFP